MAAEPAPGELEQFFRLDVKTLESARAKRRATTPLGWAVQWALCGCPDGGRGLARAERPVVRHAVPGHPHGLRPEMGRPLEVPEKRRVPELERLQLGPMRISGRAMQHALERPGGTGWCPLG